MTEGVDHVLGDLHTELNDSIAATGFALVGLRKLQDDLSALGGSPENPDPRVFIGAGDPHDPASRTPMWRLSQVREQIAYQGPVTRRLTCQWVVAFFAEWEESYRRRLGVAHGCDHNLILAPLLGDLRNLRNDVVHHRAIASAKNTGRCAVLTWFKTGDPIALTREHFAQIVRDFPWEQLRVAPGAA